MAMRGSPSSCAPQRRRDEAETALNGLRVLLATLLIASVALPALAQPPVAAASGATAGGPAWSSLSPPQRQALAPLERDWASIDEPRKAKWLEFASRFHRLPADEKERVQQRMSEWARMSPAERSRARLNFQESRQFTPEEIHRRWEAYQALPAEERKALAERPQAAAPSAGASRSPAASQGGPAQTPRVKPVAPTVVQAKPGATTTLMTQQPTPPNHQRAGQPTIAAKPGQVDSATLLPKSGPQAVSSSPRNP